MTPQNRINGALFGLAAGDRIGGPLRMALQLAASLIQQGKHDPDAVLARYLAWWRAEGFDTGPVAAMVFELVGQGVPYPEAARQVHAFSKGQTAGCNPAHRSVPLALAGFLPDDALADIAHQEAALTHYDGLAGDAAAWTVTLIRRLIRGVAWSQAVKLSLPESLRDAEIKHGGFAPDVVTAAVYFVNRESDFISALNAAVDFAGGANYCAVPAGAFAGARWGRDSIPDSALAHCPEMLPSVENAANALAKTWE